MSVPFEVFEHTISQLLDERLKPLEEGLLRSQKYLAILMTNTLMNELASQVNQVEPKKLEEFEKQTVTDMIAMMTKIKDCTEINEPFNISVKCADRIMARAEKMGASQPFLNYEPF